MNKRNHISANIDFKIYLINKKRKGALDNCTKALFWLCGLETNEHLYVCICLVMAQNKHTKQST